MAAISDMFGFLWVLMVPLNTINEVVALVCRQPVTGGEIFDLQIVATMKLNGISRIYTLNTGDFKPFLEIEPLTPSAAFHAKGKFSSEAFYRKDTHLARPTDIKVRP